MKRRRSQLLVGLLLLVLGFGLVTQVRSTREAPPLSGARQEDLVRILDDLGAREARLRQEIAALQQTQQKVSSGSAAEAAAEAQRRATTLGVLAGTLPAQGPGIVLTITDPSGQVDGPLLLDTLEELRDAGAEAVQVGTVRVGVSTYFHDRDGAVEVDGSVLRPPYRFIVLGDPETLAQALDIPGGIIDSVAALPGATASVRKSPTLRIDALRPLDPPQYAQPAPTKSGGD